MKIDERIVIPIPKNIREGSRTKRSTWVRHAILRAIWNARNRFMLDRGVDIFGVYKMTDCIEVNFRGELETKDISKEKWYIIRCMVNQRKKEKEEWEW